MIHQDPQLQALAHLRNKQSAQLNRPIIFILVGIVVFIGMSFKFGYENTIGTFAVVGSLALVILSRGRFQILSPWSQSQNRLSAQTARLEERILQGVVGSIQPALRFKLGAPNISEQFRSSDLVLEKIEYIHQHRCLTGVHANIAFCATYTDAGYYDTYKDSEERIQKIPKPVFQGLFVIADFPKVKEGWIKLHSDRLESLGWLASEWRHTNDSHHIRMEDVEFEKHFNVQASSPIEGRVVLTPDTTERFTKFRQNHPNVHVAMSLKDQTIAALLPMKANPFVIRDNPNIWTSELSTLRDTASVISDLIAAIQDPNSVTSRQAS